MALRLPGFVNAHVHLEWPARETARATGLPTWVKALRGGAPPSFEAALANAQQAYEAGTAYVVDIGNTDAGERALRRRLAGRGGQPARDLDAGLPGRDGEVPNGIALRELVGIDVLSPPEDAELAPYTPHSCYATSAAVIVACAKRAAQRGKPFSIHCDEDMDERNYLRDATGEFADYARALGRDLQTFDPPGCTPIQYLDRLGVLGPHVLLVHCTMSAADDLALVARSGASIVLCPASNLHITGRLPDVPAMFSAGVNLLIGSDSLASTPTLDLLHQVAILRRAFPNVPPQTWVDALTTRASRALGLPAEVFGELEIDAPSLGVLFDGTPWPRRWISAPEAA